MIHSLQRKEEIRIIQDKSMVIQTYHPHIVKICIFTPFWTKGVKIDEFLCYSLDAWLLCLKLTPAAQVRWADNPPQPPAPLLSPAVHGRRGYKWNPMIGTKHFLFQ